MPHPRARTEPHPRALVIRNGVLLALMTAVSTDLKLPEGIFLVIGMLIVLESPLGGGLIDAKERVLGSLMGLLAVVIASGALQAGTQPLQIFSGLTLVRLFSFAIGLNSGYVVGGHMVAGSLLNHGSHWWHYAFWRTMMTVAGVLLGFICGQIFYPRLSITAWQCSCQSWLAELANALGDVTTASHQDGRLLELRQQRDQLRQELPTLAAEQVVLDGGENRVLVLAELCLQHGSTVMSCTRDLAALLVASDVRPWVWDLPIDWLLHCGRECLQQLADGCQSNETSLQLIEIRSLIESYIHGHLKMESVESDTESSLLIASRLLLLSNALIEIAPAAVVFREPITGTPERRG
jgi:hypothetical protein